MSAITALTAQNTTGVQGIFETTPNFLGAQIDSVFTDIRPDAVKIGMVSSGDFIRKIADRLRFCEAGHVVTDPVMVSTSGSKLISDDAISVLKAELFGLSELITPNLPEGEALVERPIQTSDDMIAAAKEISETYHTAVLLKGGHHLNDANDLLFAGGDYRWFEGERIDTNNTHGTGCTLSSAIAANLAKGFDLGQSIECAKDFITGTLGYGLDLGAGSGPMNHAFDLRGRFAEGMN